MPINEQKVINIIDEINVLFNKYQINPTEVLGVLNCISIDFYVQFYENHNLNIDYLVKFMEENKDVVVNNVKEILLKKGEL